MKHILTDWSILMLIFSNIVTIIFTIIENWDLSLILLIYFCQTGIIVVFSSIKILYLKKFSVDDQALGLSDPEKLRHVKIFSASILIIIVFYGLWEYYKVLRLFGLFGELIIDLFVIISIIFFFITHFISFYVHKDKIKVEAEKHNFHSIALLTIIRILPIHIMIFIFAGFFVCIQFMFIQNIPQSTIIIFLFMKTIADVIGHIIEHNPEIILKNKIV